MKPFASSLRAISDDANPRRCSFARGCLWMGLGIAVAGAFLFSYQTLGRAISMQVNSIGQALLNGQPFWVVPLEYWLIWPWGKAPDWKRSLWPALILGPYWGLVACDIVDGRRALATQLAIGGGLLFSVGFGYSHFSLIYSLFMDSSLSLWQKIFLVFYSCIQNGPLVASNILLGVGLFLWWQNFHPISRFKHWRQQR